MHFLSEDEVEKLATAITYPEKHPSGHGAAPTGRTEFPEYGLLVRFAAHTGLRAGELGALRTGQLDLLRRREEVTEFVSEVKGRLVFGPTKTYQNRSVPMPRFLCDKITFALTSDRGARQPRQGSQACRRSRWVTRGSRACRGASPDFSEIAPEMGFYWRPRSDSNGRPAV
jgi:integrase